MNHSVGLQEQPGPSQEKLVHHFNIHKKDSKEPFTTTKKEKMGGSRAIKEKITRLVYNSNNDKYISRKNKKKYMNTTGNQEIDNHRESFNESGCGNSSDTTRKKRRKKQLQLQQNQRGSRTWRQSPSLLLNKPHDYIILDVLYNVKCK